PLHEKTISFQNKALHLHLCEAYFNKNQPPFFFWLNSDKHFFANVSDWFSTIQKGYEPLVDTLVSMQEAQSVSYFQKQINTLSTAAPLAFAVTHVRVYDAENAKMLDDMTVLVNNNVVESIGKSSEVKIPKIYKVIDGSNKTLMPGLWDMHAHYDKS